MGTWTCRWESVKEATGYFLLVMVGTGTGGRPGRRKGSGTVCLALNGVCHWAVGTWDPWGRGGRGDGDLQGAGGEGPSRAAAARVPSVQALHQILGRSPGQI